MAFAPRFRHCYDDTSGPPAEVSSLWLRHCSLADLLSCMCVSRSWQTFATRPELWHVISLGKISKRGKIALGGYTRQFDHPAVLCQPDSALGNGAPRLGNLELNRLLALPRGGLRELTLVRLSSITSHALFALRASPVLMTVTIIECPKVDDHVALALPPSVHFLKLSCDAVTAHVMGMLPPTVESVELVGSALTRHDMQLCQPPPGCGIDVSCCRNCELPTVTNLIFRCVSTKMTTRAATRDSIPL